MPARFPLPPTVPRRRWAERLTLIGGRPPSRRRPITHDRGDRGTALRPLALCTAMVARGPPAAMARPPIAWCAPQRPTPVPGARPRAAASRQRHRARREPSADTLPRLVSM